MPGAGNHQRGNDRVILAVEVGFGKNQESRISQSVLTQRKSHQSGNRLPPSRRPQLQIHDAAVKSFARPWRS